MDLLAIRSTVSQDACWAERPLGIYGILVLVALLGPPFAWCFRVWVLGDSDLRDEHRRTMARAWNSSFTTPPKEELWSESYIPSISAALAIREGQWIMLICSLIAYPWSIVCFDNPQVWGLICIAAAEFYGVGKTSWKEPPHYVVVAIMAVCVCPAIILVNVLFLLPQQPGAATALLVLAGITGVLFLSFPTISHALAKTPDWANRLERWFPCVEYLGAVLFGVSLLLVHA